MASSTSTAIAVTGSTGALGGYVARDLADRGVAQRLLVRTPARAPRLPDSTVHQFSYSDREASTAALDGVAVLFMVSASESVDRLDQHRSFVDAAEAAGVEHVVYTSFAAAAPDATFTLARDHHATEEHIKSSSMKWTFLRDSFYIDFLEALVGDDDVIRGPAGDGRASFVARSDVARTAATILVDPSTHAGRTYDLTGPEALTLAEVAATLARERDRAITFHDESIEEAYRSRAAFGAPDWQLDAWVSTYTAIASNVMAGVSSDVETITGTPPIDLETYLRRHHR
ncbi:SDR family oxidoreductase [Aeromicrobium sp.]|uniref:SDR family oxidoreductase n=1 Tax=Aeromicrobium sp. TaxID=1871063 RepID=UPI0028AD4219|nr:SDR family oxidoreductase [Aeromicrobium sp.]